MDEKDYAVGEGHRKLFSVKSCENAWITIMSIFTYKIHCFRLAQVCILQPALVMNQPRSFLDPEDASTARLINPTTRICLHSQFRAIQYNDIPSKKYRTPYSQAMDGGLKTRYPPNTQQIKADKLM